MSSKDIELETTENVFQHEHIEKTEPLTVSKSKDVGGRYAAIASATEFSAVAQRKYVRRIDMILMPILFISYGLQYTDKSILNSAAQFGIVQDLGLYDIVMLNGVPQTSLSKYSYCVMQFYWGYFIGSTCRVVCGIRISGLRSRTVLPSTYLAQRFPIGWFVGGTIITWSIVTMSTAGVTNYAGLMVNRLVKLIWALSMSG